MIILTLIFIVKYMVIRTFLWKLYYHTESCSEHDLQGFSQKMLCVIDT